MALTSIAFKCTEKIVFKRLRSETTDTTTPCSLPIIGRNTEDAILTLLHKLYQHLDRPKTFTRVLFVDCSSAFNTIQPHLLIKKLQAMEVSQTVISWLSSYLTERPQKVRIDEALSNMLVTKMGAPIGCMLSPVLFTDYRRKQLSGQVCWRYLPHQSVENWWNIQIHSGQVGRMVWPNLPGN